MRDSISYYFFLFVVYSFVGWFWESVFCSLYYEHKLINRGFLNGPYCPIYGVGAVTGLLTLSGIENTVVLFFAAAFMTCALEYFTSWAMEKLFHARWWDYSNEPLNINGRVYIGGFLAFGFGIVALIRVVNPFVTSLIIKIPFNWFNGICAVLFGGIVFDLAVTLSGLSGFGEKLRELTAALEKARSSTATALGSVRETAMDKIQKSVPYETVEAVTSKITASAPYNAMTELYEKFSEKLSHQQKRIMRAFPKLRTVRYTHVFAELRRITLHKRSKSEKR